MQPHLAHFLSNSQHCYLLKSEQLVVVVKFESSLVYKADSRTVGAVSQRNSAPTNGGEGQHKMAAVCQFEENQDVLCLRTISELRDCELFSVPLAEEEKIETILLMAWELGQ